MTRESVDLGAIELPEIITRKMADPEKVFLPFATPIDDAAPDFLPSVIKPWCDRPPLPMALTAISPWTLTKSMPFSSAWRRR